MQYVYVLKSKKDNSLYVGCTNNIPKRLFLHNSGKNVYTKRHIPFILVHYEVFLNKSDAFAREQWLKTGWGRNHLKKVLYNFLNSKNLGG